MSLLEALDSFLHARQLRRLAEYQEIIDRNQTPQDDDAERLAAAVDRGWVTRRQIEIDVKLANESRSTALRDVAGELQAAGHFDALRQQVDRATAAGGL